MKIEGTVNEIGAIETDAAGKIIKQGIVVQVNQNERLKAINLYEPALVFTGEDITAYEKQGRLGTDLVNYLVKIGVNFEQYRDKSAIEVAIAEMERNRVGDIAQPVSWSANEREWKAEQETATLTACVDALLCIDDQRVLNRILRYLDDRFTNSIPEPIEPPF
jgi:hypothetical protein